jgi:hypothetical protein
MTAKEQAYELVMEQFKINPFISLTRAKLYAQYAADDIILALDPGPMYRNGFIYWQNVKTEIDLVEI